MYTANSADDLVSWLLSCSSLPAPCRRSPSSKMAASGRRARGTRPCDCTMTCSSFTVWTLGSVAVVVVVMPAACCILHALCTLRLNSSVSSVGDGGQSQGSHTDSARAVFCTGMLVDTYKDLILPYAWNCVWECKCVYACV